MALAIQLDSSSIYRESWVPSFPLFALIRQGINAYASERGYRVHLLVNRPGQDVAAMLESEILSENVVDGVVLFSTTSEAVPGLRAVAARLAKARVAMVTIGELLASAEVPIVSINLGPAMLQAAHRLAELGSRRAAYIGTFKQWAHERTPRLRLISESLCLSGIQLVDAREVNENVSAYQQTLDLVAQETRPDCIIYGTDYFAMAGLKALHHAGLRVPQEVRVLGIDCAPYAAETSIRLASLDHRYFDWGQAIARVLLEQICHPKQPIPARTELEAYFVEGETLGDARSQCASEVRLERSLSCVS